MTERLQFAPRPFHFGEPAEPMLGVYHEPGGAARGEGVVLCGPVGHEYFRAHWILRRLADLLAAQGVPALRFDYHGTGDSAGDWGEGILQRWIADTHTAMQELRDMAGVARVSLFGMRLGAAIAAGAAAPEANVRRLALWDPVVSGLDYLEHLETLHRVRLRSSGVSRPPADPLGGPRELVGYRYPADMLEALRSLALDNAPPAAEHVLVLSASRNPADARLVDALQAAGTRAGHEVTGEGGNWDRVDGVARCSNPALDRAVGFLAGKDGT